MRLLAVAVGGALIVASATGVSAQERLQRARQECWAQMGYPNGPVGNNAMRVGDQVSTCVRAKMAAGQPGDGQARGQGRPQR